MEKKYLTRIKIDIIVNRVIQALLFFLFVSNISASFLDPIYAVFVIKSVAGATLTTVGFAMAIFAITKSVFQVPLARRIDKGLNERDEFYIMLAGAFLGALQLYGLIFVQTVAGLYFLSALNGFAAACLFAAYYSLFSAHVDKASRGFEWSLFSVGGLTISAAIGGALGGVLADYLGFRITLALAGSLHLFSALILTAFYSLLDGGARAKPAAQQVPSP